MRPTVTSQNRHQKKYKVNNPKVSILSLTVPRNLQQRRMRQRRTRHRQFSGGSEIQGRRRRLRRRDDRPGEFATTTETSTEEYDPEVSMTTTEASDEELGEKTRPSERL